MSKDEVLLVTCFLDNYGACLQAYALQCSLKKLGVPSEILNYVEPLGYTKKKTFREWLKDNELSYLLRVLILKSSGYDYLRHFRFIGFRKKHLIFYPGTFTNYSDIEKHHFSQSTFICGSDQIWNPTFYGECNRVYMLDFVKPEQKRIAYAPSIGLQDIPEVYRESFSRMVNKFDYISVREETGRRIVEKYTNKNTVSCIDPTLLMNKSEWETVCASRNVPTDNYIFCYFFGDNDDLYKAAIEKCKTMLGCNAVIVPFHKEHKKMGCKTMKYVGPVEFVALISKARLVLTDSFHATAFSINLNIPFYSFLRSDETDVKSMNSRIYDILKLCKLENRIINDVKFITDEMVDFSRTNNILADKRKKDLRWLKDALQTHQV